MAASEGGRRPRQQAAPQQEQPDHSAQETQEADTGQKEAQSQVEQERQDNVKTRSLEESAKYKAAAFQGVEADEFNEQEVYDPEEAQEAGFFGKRVALDDEKFSLQSGPDSP